MKIENVSKKIIGNADFRLLPGETTEVSGEKLWVKRGLAKGALKEVAEVPAEAAETAPEAAEAAAEESSGIAAETAPEAAEAAEEASTTKTKKTRSKKTTAE